MTEIPLNCRSESEHDALRQQLARIFKSASFQQSARRQRFLNYLVTEAMCGRGERLKAYNIALEVFERPASFDPNIDPFIRVEAARLRDKLREYYVSGGQDDPIYIDLPKGGYVPIVEYRQGAPQVPLGGAPESADAKPLDTVQAPASHVKEQPAPTRPSWTTMGRWPLALSAVVLIALLAAGFWFSRQPRGPSSSVAAEDTETALAKIPAIAVLPFLNLNDDAKQDYFSDGLTEDILTELASSRELRVLARNTSFQFKGQTADIQQIGRNLNARYALEGSVRRAGDRLRVTAQLIDTRTGTELWAERYDRELADLFLVQDEIVNAIVGKIAGGYGVIQQAETKSTMRKSPAEIQAYDLILRAREVMAWNWTGENFAHARELLNQAIALDPSNARARRELAWFSILGWVFRLDSTPVPPDEITTQATKAVQLDGADARARMVSASAYFFTKQLGLFSQEADQALALAPYDAEIIATLACMISSAGDHQRGVELAKRANAINPDAAIGWYHSTVYTAAYLAGDYLHALEVARQNKQTDVFYAYIEIIPIYGQLGRKREAKDAWKKLREQIPNASAATFSDWWRLWNIHEDEVSRLMDGVYRSGVLTPEAGRGQ